MQRRLSLTVVLTSVVCGLTGCQSVNEEKLEDSRAAWNALAREQDNTYSYAVHSQSWTGFATRTAIQIQNGTPTYRRFESTPMIPETPLSLQWEERGAELGSHSGAPPAATMEKLYDRCATEVLTQNAGTNEITLRFDGRNLLIQCTYVPDNCADDCLFGVSVAELEMGLKY